MAWRRQVHCINTSSSHGRITHIGGIYADGSRWRVTTEEAISKIKSKEWEFYVASGKRETDIIIGNRMGTEYLRTKDDGTDSNNLSALPEC